VKGARWKFHEFRYANTGSPHTRHRLHDLFAAVLAVVGQVINLRPRQQDANLLRTLCSRTRGPAVLCVTRATPLKQSPCIRLTRSLPSTLDDVRAFKRVASMRCTACGTAMRLEQVVPAKVMRAQGYEYRLFKCSCCPWTERRLAFVPQDTLTSDEPASTRTALKIVATPSKDTLTSLRAWAHTMGKLRSR
jgi:hypothetical protein